MGRARLKFNYKAFNEVRKSDAVTRDLIARGQRMAKSAGEGVVVRWSKGRSRTRVFVVTDTAEARKAAATDHTLERAIDAGRG